MSDGITISRKNNIVTLSIIIGDNVAEAHLTSEGANKVASSLMVAAAGCRGDGDEEPAVNASGRYFDA